MLRSIFQFIVEEHPWLSAWVAMGAAALFIALSLVRFGMLHRSSASVSIRIRHGQISELKIGKDGLELGLDDEDGVEVEADDEEPDDPLVGAAPASEHSQQRQEQEQEQEQQNVGSITFDPSSTASPPEIYDLPEREPSEHAELDPEGSEREAAHSGEAEELEAEALAPEWDIPEPGAPASESPAPQAPTGSVMFRKGVPGFGYNAGPTPLWMEPPDRVAAGIVDICFGTDRMFDPKKGFTGNRGRRLVLGTCHVSVPHERPPGAITRPRRLFRIQLEHEDPRKHFIIQDIVVHDKRDLIEIINSDFEKSLSPALLFVHGYNTDFDGGAFRAAQLAVDLDILGHILYYSWPSRANFLNYDYDAESIKQSRVYFCEFLNVLSNTGIRHINIIAHSKGSELLLESLLSASEVETYKISQVILASPDVDSDFAAQIIPSISNRVDGLTLYASDEDLAIAASKAKVGGPSRAGALLDDGYPLIVDGLDSIDATSCKMRLMEFNHNAFVADTVLRYDIAQLFWTGRRPPHERSPSIRPRSCSRGKYWFLEPR
jgi:esterase/lipase superfamily enzyme